MTAPSQAGAVAVVQATAPERIYLTVSDTAYDAGEPFPSDHEGICWCEDEAVDVCVPYVRADLAAVPVEALEGLVAKWREQIDANRKKPFRTAEEGAMCDTLDQAADELTTLIKERSNG